MRHTVDRVWLVADSCWLRHRTWDNFIAVYGETENVAGTTRRDRTTKRAMSIGAFPDFKPTKKSAMHPNGAFKIADALRAGRCDEPNGTGKANSNATLSIASSVVASRR
jgi:hypothetical protein